MELKTRISPITALFSFVASLTFLGVIVLGVSVFPAPQNPLAFNTCELPCILGITPGETTYSQAMQIIEATIPPDQIIEQGHFWINDVDGTKIYITLKRSLPNPSDSITSIELSSHNQGEITSLGNLLVAGHAPQRVFRARFNGPNVVNLLIVFGENMELMAYVPASQFVSPFSPVNKLTIAAYEDRDWVLRDSQGVNLDQEISWMGFLSIARYLDA